MVERHRPTHRSAYATLFGLLATTGLRLSEALALDLLDVDLRNGVLSIRRTKFGKSRFVPIRSTTRCALQRYARLRERLVPRAAEPAFLLSERGTRIKQCSARYNFVVVSRAIGLRAPARVPDLLQLATERATSDKGLR
ncbi:MAG: tyrosine-type recombinase/integrase [Deltaproteobacteria bacterium]|nr:tyrosine-type recombinase/integrase [Deltaproteobacteria bacterium]